MDNIEEANKEIDYKRREIEKEILGITPQAALKAIFEEGRKLRELLKTYYVFMEAAGNVGAGKSTAMDLVGVYGHIPVLCELEGENKLLEMYYQDKRRFSLSLQLHFFNERAYRILLHIIQNSCESFASDRSRREDAIVFCLALNREGYLSDEDNRYCQWYFRWLNSEIEAKYNLSLEPNLIVFVNPPREVIERQVRERGRKIEIGNDQGRGLDPKLQETLYQVYEEYPEILRENYHGLTLTLSPQDAETSAATGIKGQLYIVKSVKEALRIAVERGCLERILLH